MMDWSTLSIKIVEGRRKASTGSNVQVSDQYRGRIHRQGQDREVMFMGITKVDKIVCGDKTSFQCCC